MELTCQELHLKDVVSQETLTGLLGLSLAAPLTL